LDQRRALLEVDTTIGRDIRKEDIPTIVSTLESWYDTCETVLTSLQTQVDRANAEKVQKNQRKEALEQEVHEISILENEAISFESITWLIYFVLMFPLDYQSEENHQNPGPGCGRSLWWWNWLTRSSWSGEDSEEVDEKKYWKPGSQVIQVIP